MKFSNQWSPVCFLTQVQQLVFPKLELITNALATSSRRRSQSRPRIRGDDLSIKRIGKFRQGRHLVLANEGESMKHLIATLFLVGICCSSAFSVTYQVGSTRTYKKLQDVAPLLLPGDI